MIVGTLRVFDKKRLRLLRGSLGNPIALKSTRHLPKKLASDPSDIIISEGIPGAAREAAIY